MSSSEDCGINCKCFKCKGRKHVSLTQIARPACSDSDSPIAKNGKRKTIRRVLSDGQGNSETDSFEVGLGLVKRKKRKHTPRVMSDEEGSSGSGPRPARRKSSARVVSDSEEGSSSDEYESSGIDDKEEGEIVETRESDDVSSDSWEDGEESGSASSGWESDWTSVEEDCVENDIADRVVKPTAAASSGAVNSNFDSDSSDGQSEKCPICLRNFASQEVGTPESCDHSFCATCLQEWAKNMNTCPVDRQAFTLILVRSCLEGKIIRRIPVEPREHREDDEEIHEDPTPCEICGRCDREDRLLLCDQCDSGYHLECLDPPLETVPVEEWFCPECVVANSTQIADEAPIGEGELFDLIDDAHATIGTSPLRRRVNRLLPRTRQSERVRSTIIRQEIERQAEAGNIQPSTSSGVDSLDSASRLSLFFGSRQPAKVKKRVVRKKRKRTIKKVRKRKTTTSTKTSSRSKTTTKCKVSITKKSATTKRKVKKKRKTKRRTKKKVANFNSDSSIDDSYRSVRSSSKKYSHKSTKFGPYKHAYSSKSVKTHTTKHMSKRKIEDSDSDSNKPCSSKSFKRHCPANKKLGNSPVIISDSSDSNTCIGPRSYRSSKKSKSLSRRIIIVSDSSSDDDTFNKPSSSHSKKRKSNNKPIVISDTSDSEEFPCLSKSLINNGCVRKKPIIISDSSTSDSSSSSYSNDSSTS